MRDIGAADEADRGDGRVLDDGIDHFFIAVNDLKEPFGRARFDKQFRKAHRHRRIALRGFEDEGVARCNRHTEHPHRDHGGEVERGDASANAERLAKRINVNTGASAGCVFAFEDLRNTAGVFDHFKAALHVSHRVGHRLAVLARKQLGERLHIGFDQLLELEHHARAFLRVGRGPFGLHGLRGGHRLVEQRAVTQRNLGLNLAR